MRDSPFYRTLAGHVSRLGGYHNAHLHLDRAYTGEADTGGAGDAHLSLSQKHGRISALHQSAYYRPDNLSRRLRHALGSMIACGTRRVDSVIDTTDDGLGLSALQTALDIRAELAGQIDFRAAVYSPLGFRDDAPAAWDLIEAGAKIANFIGCLPEKDDTRVYPGQIGYGETCRRMIDLAHRADTFVHVHTDQMNSADDDGTETLLSVLDADNPFAPGEPRVWAVHVISPSAYDDARWDRLVARLLEHNVGVIVCPSGALGMRQLRRERAPTHNSIARVLELCAAGVPVRLGNDNCADMLSPSTTTDLTDEVFLLSAAVRYYDTEILAHLACGVDLPAPLRARVADHLRAQDV